MSQEYIPEYQETSQAFNAYLMEIEERLEIFKRALLGMKKNPTYGLVLDDKGTVDYNDWVKEENAQMVNTKGAISIYNRLAMQVSKITRSTNLTTDQIGILMVYFVETFGNWLIDNIDEWDLRLEHFENLLEQAQSVYYFALNSSKDGYLIDMLTRGYESRETNDVREDENKIFPFGMNFGGKK